MTAIYVDPADVTPAVVAWLTDATGFPFGDSRAPAGVPAPYGVVYEIPGTRTGPPLTGESAFLEAAFQVTSVGAANGQPVPQQARLLGSRVAKAWVGADVDGVYATAAPVIPGTRVAQRWSAGDGHMEVGDLVAEWVETFHLLLLPA